MNTVRLVTPAERTEGEGTPGMRREQAFRKEGLWVGLVRTAPGTVSGWHHHGDHDTAVYVVKGVARVEYGPGGRRSVEARAGDFVLVPSGVVHRESNPSEEEAEAVVVRAGRGTPTFNVDGPPGV